MQRQHEDSTASVIIKHLSWHFVCGLVNIILYSLYNTENQIEWENYYQHLKVQDVPNVSSLTKLFFFLWSNFNHFLRVSGLEQTNLKKMIELKNLSNLNVKKILAKELNKISLVYELN